MVHKQMLRSKEGIIIETEDAPLLMTNEEFEKCKKRFRKSFSHPEMIKFLTQKKSK
jgi:hypothetical protein